jgi:hypothetical protein
LAQYLAHPLHKLCPLFGALVRLRELVYQAQKLFSLIVDQGVSQPGFPSGFSRPDKASAHGVCGVQNGTGFGSRSRLPIL